MTVSQDTLIRFVYGELSADEARDVTRALERDPALRALVEEQRKLRAALESARESEIAPAPEPAPPASPKEMRGRNLIAGAAMLTGLGLGLLLAASFGIGSEIGYARGALIAKGALANALTTQFSGAPQAGVTVLSTFWSTRDSFCRSFVTRRSAAHALAGIACREDGAWHVVATAELAPNTAKDGAIEERDLPQPIRAAARALTAGEPLDAEAESAARGQDWRPR